MEHSSAAMRGKLIKLAFEVLLIVVGLVFLVWWYGSGQRFNVKPIRPAAIQFEAGPNRSVYRIMTAGERFPRLKLAVIEPKDVKPGDIQQLTVEVEDPAGISRVYAETELDHGLKRLPLELRLGSNQSGFWTNAWRVSDTTSKTYRTKFFAVNQKGQAASVVLAWSDPCTPPLAGDWTVDASCSISGVTGADNGNINFTGAFTMTINAGATVAFNSGKQISLGTSGVIAVADTAQIKKTKLWITDADADNYAPSSYSTLAQDSRPSGYSRRYSIAGTNDCYDAGATTNPGQTGWFTVTDGRGSWDYNCSGATDYQYGTTANLCGCSDSSMTPGYTTNPGCGVAGTYYTSCSASGLCGSKTSDSSSNYVTNSVSQTQACH